MAEPVDEWLLGESRAMWSELDPPPTTLVNLTCFALETTTPSTEVLRSGRQEFVGARGDANTRLVTFDGDLLTVMVNILVLADDAVWLDEWLIPAASQRIELRLASGETLEMTAVAGRFAFDRASRGLAQILLHVNGTVTTPSIVL
ncbi:hypothetical protein ACFWN2_08590 [Lentzea sp. NPDC058436]|uniref:hypothetical protein n=1 Tax=Lentzea sp. NPDC058436 TaxID=3346499 RepID=UPI0036508783